MSGDGNRSIVKHFRRYGALYIMLILPMTVPVSYTHLTLPTTPYV